VATANFHARIERIQNAQGNLPVQKNQNFRTPGVAGVAAATAVKRRRRHPIRDHVLSIALGSVLGTLLAVMSLGLSAENAPWGPQSTFHQIAYYATMGGFGLAPVLLVVSLITAARRPGFALFSLAYITGIVLPLAL
jgi:hypothetical protein